jgi:hypothetical protein
MTPDECHAHLRQHHRTSADRQSVLVSHRIYVALPAGLLQIVGRADIEPRGPSRTLDTTYRSHARRMGSSAFG